MLISMMLALALVQQPPKPPDIPFSLPFDVITQGQISCVTVHKSGNVTANGVKRTHAQTQQHRNAAGRQSARVFQLVSAIRDLYHPDDLFRWARCDLLGR
jgi:hypothetical protein